MVSRLTSSGCLRSRLAVLIALLAPVGLCAQEEPVKPMRVPFDVLKTQHIVINVKVNGKGPYRLIFDTGAPVTLINNKVAKEADVFGKDFKRPAFALFGALGQVKIKTLTVGDVTAENIPAMVMDHPTVDAISNAFGPIEGIVGFSFFARYKMTLDYQAKEMTFVPTKFEPPDMLDSITKSIMAGRNNPKKKILAPGGLIGIKVKKEADDMDAGVTIQDVFAGSPAAAAELKTGDRLLTLDGRWTDSVLECYEAATMVRPGEIRVVIKRDGKELTRTLKIQPGL